MITGKELAQKIYDQITEHPETHNQAVWKDPYGECGTTYCIAGWAVEFNLPAPAGLKNERTWRWQARQELAGELGAQDSHWPNLAAKLLDLSPEQEDELFYCPTSEAPEVLAEMFGLEAGE